MEFEESKGVEKFASKAGYLFSYLVFTTVLFFILSLLEKIPKNWNYLHVVGITLSIVIVGKVVQGVLK